MTFRDFPADVLSRFWAAVVRALPPEQVAEVWTQADIQRLKNELHRVRVVLVYSGQDRILSSNVLDWLIELRRAGGKPLPAVLSVYHRNSIETPGTTLIAQGNEESCNDLRQWLQHDTSVGVVHVEDGLQDFLSVDSAQLRSAIRQAAEGRTPFSIRDIHLVTGLSTGMIINQSLQASSVACSIPKVGPDQYAEVHRLLNERPFHVIDRPHDDVTLQMVARANAYLKMTSEDATQQPTRMGGRSGSFSTLQETIPANAVRHRHITRRELVDLGDPNSGIVKRLVEYLLQSGDYESLKKIGVEGGFGGSPHIRELDTSSLVKTIPSWTYKMVRSRFGRLQSEGLIEAQKAAQNAALEYTVPEQLVSGRSLFGHLPSPEEVKAKYTSV